MNMVEIINLLLLFLLAFYFKYFAANENNKLVLMVWLCLKKKN